MILDANEVKIAHENVEEALKKIENTMENEISMIALCALAHSLSCYIASAHHLLSLLFFFPLRFSHLFIWSIYLHDLLFQNWVEYN